MNSEANIQFRLRSIEELSFSYAATLFSTLDITEHNLGVQYVSQSYIDVDTHSIKQKVGVKYHFQETELMQLEMLFNFRFEDLNSLVIIDRDNHQLEFKANLIPSLVNIAIGGLRGVLYEKTKATPLACYPLPLVDVQQLMKHNSYHIE